MQKNKTSKKSKYIVNEKIQSSYLFGKNKEEDLSKKYLSPEILEKKDIIKGEETLGIQKNSVGGLIIITESIGREIETEFNERQHNHIRKKTLSHKILCERRDEASALLFITLYDLIGEEYYSEKYKTLNRSELCSLIHTNIYNLVEIELPWLVSYSKHIIRDYYSVGTNRLKIKPNYILDDGVKDEYLEEDLQNKGGLILNGLLEVLEFYDKNLTSYIDENIGILCQILIPSGLPRNKKWIQIDVGISFSGKRHYKESVKDSLIRIARDETHIEIHEDVIDESLKDFPTAKKLNYGGLRNGEGYEGVTVPIIEILYPDQIKICDEKILEFGFCKCQEREKIINNYKKNN